jgi:hypothetical protein
MLSDRLDCADVIANRLAEWCCDSCSVNGWVGWCAGWYDWCCWCYIIIDGLVDDIVVDLL